MSERKYLRIEELRIFRQVLYERYQNNPSMILRFLMMYEMGMRRGEVVMARVENLEAFVRSQDMVNYDPRNAVGFTLSIVEGGGRAGKTKSDRISKTGKVKSGSRTIPTSKNFRSIILTYIEPLGKVFDSLYGQRYDVITNAVNGLLMRDDVKGYIIYPQGKDSSTHLSPHTINDNLEQLEKLCRQRGLRIHLTPHKFRHTFAIHYLHNSQNTSEALVRLQKILGHTSLNTTAIYLQMSMEDDIKHYDETMKAFDEALNSTSSREKNERQVIDDIDRIYNPSKPPTDDDYRRYDRIIDDALGDDY